MRERMEAVRPLVMPELIDRFYGIHALLSEWTDPLQDNPELRLQRETVAEQFSHISLEGDVPKLEVVTPNDRWTRDLSIAELNKMVDDGEIVIEQAGLAHFLQESN